MVNGGLCRFRTNKIKLVHQSARGMDPFVELRKHAGSKHPQKAKLNIVLSAITEIIYERRGQRDAKPISNTEYFAALMTGLDAATNSHQHEIIYLLAMVLPFVPEAVLRAKYQAISQCIVHIIQHATEDTSLFKSSTTCLGLVLLAQEPSSTTWARPDVLKAFQLLLSLATDTRPKVRKVAQKSVVEILSFHLENHCETLSTHIASFCENVFAASRSKDEARLVLLIGFLKNALPFLQRKVICSLVDTLSIFLSSSSKTLRLVTLEAYDALASSSVATPRLTQDTLHKMILSILQGESTVQEIDEVMGTYAVRTIGNALVKLFAINEPVTKELLPRVVVLVCSHFESSNKRVRYETKQSLTKIMKNCVQPQELVHSVAFSSRVILSLESLLTLRFQVGWAEIFDCLIHLFEHYGSASFPAFENILRTCCELYEAIEQMPMSNAPKEMSEYFIQLTSKAVSVLGPQVFLQIIPLVNVQEEKEKKKEILNEKRLWLLPILKENLKKFPCTLDFFAENILQLARQCEIKSRHSSATPLWIKKYQTYTSQLWSLFPSFCTKASDIDKNFKKIAKILANAMEDKRYPELRLFVCQGLLLLVKNVNGQNNNDRKEKKELGTVDEKDQKALAKYPSRYLPLLIEFVEELDPEKDMENVQILLDTIDGFASLSEASYMTTLFKKVMQKLLEATTQYQKISSSNDCSKATTSVSVTALKLKRTSHAQMALAMALIRSIDETNVTLLYRVIKPYLLDDTDPSMQKRAYAVLVSICEHHPFFVTSESNLKDMTDSLCESLLTCSIPAKKMRLRCLYHIITAMENCYLSKDNSITTLLPNHTELVPNLIGEIMLCTKEANGKAREAAFDLLLAMARLMHHTQPSNGLMEFLQMLLGGLAARTPHMRSAAVICLSRVVFEFGREEILIQQAMPQLMKTVLMLLHEKAREVIKSVIGFMKLGIAMLSKEQLRVFVPDIIQGLLLWIGESKNRFRAKTRIILIKLCRKYSYEEIAEIVPEKDRALIKHIKKTKEREEKKKQQHRQDNKSNSTINDAFTDFMKDDSDEDSDDDHPMYDENGGLMHEEDLTDGEDQYVTPFLKKKQTNKRRTSKKDSSLSSAGQWIKEDEDEIVDFLDSGAVRHLMSGRGQAEDDEEEDDGLIQVAKDGRFIINEPPLEDKKKSLKKNKDEDEDMVESDNEEASIKKDVAAQLQKMGFGNTSHNKRKREEETAGTGKEYKAKKAGGDIKKKGKLEPYAYIPLDPKLMAKRNKRIAVSKYNQVGGKKRQGNKKR